LSARTYNKQIWNIFFVSSIVANAVSEVFTIDAPFIANFTQKKFDIAVGQTIHKDRNFWTKGEVEAFWQFLFLKVSVILPEDWSAFFLFSAKPRSNNLIGPTQILYQNY